MSAPNPRIQELAEQIRYHADLYFNKSTPEITDAEFDALVAELTSLDPSNPALLEVGANPNYGTKVQHTAVMGSLEKAKTHDDIKTWFAACSTSEGKGILVSPKIDGLAVELRYVEGVFTQAVTRGNGDFGQDVTANANAITDIPKAVPVAGKFNVRGEIYMKRSVFEKAGEGANPRNLASGKFTCQDPRETTRANLSFLGYDFIHEGRNPIKDFETEEAKLRFLSTTIGAANVISWKLFPEVNNDLAAHLFDWENHVRAKLDYEIDGMVLAANSLSEQDQAGWSGKCPRGKVAYKFKPEQKVAEVVNVEWFVGRTGKVTPVLVINPTKVAGSTITNLSLHNYKIYKSFDLHVGDKVLIEKAGDIIPQVVRKYDYTASPNPQGFDICDCPACGERTHLDANGVFMLCGNASCPSQLERRILHYLGCYEILGIGPGIVEKLCKAGMVKDLPGLYNLDLTALKTLLGGTTGQNVFDVIMEKSEPPLHQFLDALGIDGLGTSTSKMLAKEFQTLARVRSLVPAELVKLEGIGALTANKIVDGLAALAPTIDALVSCIDVQEVKLVVGTLTGRSFCLTGAMNRQRSVIEKDIEAHGGTIKSCGRGLDFLVQADVNSTSSKSVKAKSLGVRIISEAQLEDFMANGVK